jgi:2-keto-3-deoxy-L-rhamnonate aldolase RhmA
MELIFITRDPFQAQAMARAGVDRIMVDLEINGKEARQGHLNAVISRHTPQDVSTIRRALDHAGTGVLMVRVNPLGQGTPAEIENILDRGADRIMLPMFTHPDEVARCLDLIAGRAPLTLLLETAAALARLPQILTIKGIDDFHIGLNDLHLDMGLDFMFELFGSGLLDHAARLIQAAGLRFGIGGVACIGTGMLPAEAILGAHMHLGSERVILSRTFAKTLEGGGSAEDEIRKLRAYVARKDLDLLALRKDLDCIARQIANSRRSSKRFWRSNSLIS